MQSSAFGKAWQILNALSQYVHASFSAFVFSPQIEVASGESSPEHFFDSAHWAQMQQAAWGSG